MPMNLSSYMGQLESPNNYFTNYLRGNMNQALSSAQSSIGTRMGDMGWGSRSGIVGKLQTMAAMDALGQFQHGMMGAEQMRLDKLGPAVIAQANIESQEKMQREAIAAQERAAKQQMLGSIFGALGGGLGAIAGGGLQLLLGGGGGGQNDLMNFLYGLMGRGGGGETSGGNK